MSVCENHPFSINGWQNSFNLQPGLKCLYALLCPCSIFPSNYLSLGAACGHWREEPLCEVLSLECVSLLCFAYRATTLHTADCRLVRGIPLAIWSLYFSSAHPSMPWSEKRAASQLADWLGACTKPFGGSWAPTLVAEPGEPGRKIRGEAPHHPERGRHAGERVLRDVGRRSGHLGRLHSQGATATGKDSLLETAISDPNWHPA